MSALDTRQAGPIGPTEQVDETARLAREGMIYSAFSIIGKITGFVREWLVAFFFGAGIVSDAYRVSLDLMKSISWTLSGNTIETSLVPLLTRWRVRSILRSRAILFRSVAWASMALGVVAMFVLGFGDNLIARIQAPDYSAQDLDTMAMMLRWIGPAIPIYTATSIFTFLLMSVKRFRIVGLTSTLLNIGQILGVVGAGLGWLPLEAMPISYSVGLVFGGVLLVLDARTWWPREKARATFARVSLFAGKFINLFWPLLVIGLANQLRIFLEKRIVSRYEIGAIAALYFARFIIETPLMTFGLSLLRMLLPHFSELVEKKDTAALKRQYLILLDFTLWLLLPIILLLFAAARPVITLVYGYGAFNQQAIELTALALIGSTPGLWTALINPMTNRILIAQGRTLVLLPFGLMQAALNIALAYLLGARWGIAGVAVAMGISQFILTLMMLPWLRLKVTIPALARISLWWGWAAGMVLLLHELPLPDRGVVAIVSTALVILPGWIAASFLFPHGKENLNRMLSLVKRMRSKR